MPHFCFCGKQNRQKNSAGELNSTASVALLGVQLSLKHRISAVFPHSTVEGKRACVTVRSRVTMMILDFDHVCQQFSRKLFSLCLWLDSACGVKMWRSICSKSAPFRRAFSSQYRPLDAVRNLNGVRLFNRTNAALCLEHRVPMLMPGVRPLSSVRWVFQLRWQEKWVGSSSDPERVFLGFADFFCALSRSAHSNRHTQTSKPRFRFPKT